MNPLKQALGALRNLTPLFIVSALCWLVSHHGKRILFIVSVYSKLTPSDEPDIDILEKLNRAMGLSKTKEALLLPAHYHRYIWNEDKLNKAIELFEKDGVCPIVPHDESLQRFTESIVDSCPSSLKYARRADMIEDVRQLLQRRRDGAIPA